MSKTKHCKVCSKEIASNAKMCPGCGAKNSKPFYKRIWFWVITLIILIAIGSSNPEVEQQDNIGENQNKITEDNSNVKENKDIKTEKKVPKEYRSALKKAKMYSDTMHMSKEGIYDQLTSEYGEKFSPESAQYAIDNVKADWNKNALKTATVYQETMDMSPSAIYDQLTSEYGEKFTDQEAQYAIDNLKK